MSEFVCGPMSHAKLSLHWSIVHYQVTFEWFNSGSETSIGSGQNKPNIIFLELDKRQPTLG